MIYQLVNNQLRFVINYRMRIMPDPASSCDLKDLAAPNEDTLNRQRSLDDAPSPSLPPSLPLLLILLLPSLALPLPLLLQLPPLPLLLLLRIPLLHLRRRRPIPQIDSHFWPSSYSITPFPSCTRETRQSRQCMTPTGRSSGRPTASDGRGRSHGRPRRRPTVPGPP